MILEEDSVNNADDAREVNVTAQKTQVVHLGELVLIESLSFRAGCCPKTAIGTLFPSKPILTMAYHRDVFKEGREV